MPIKLKGDAQQCLFNYLFRYVRRQFLMSVGTDGKALMHPMFLRYLVSVFKSFAKLRKSIF